MYYKSTTTGQRVKVHGVPVFDLVKVSIDQLKSNKVTIKNTKKDINDKRYMIFIKTVKMKVKMTFYSKFYSK